MSITAVRPIVADWYTPVEEAGEETPTRFKIAPLDQVALLEVFGNGEVRADGSFLPTHNSRMLLLQKGVQDWENLKAGDGVNLPFSRQNLSQVPARILGELSTEILTRSALRGDQE